MAKQSIKHWIRTVTAGLLFTLGAYFVMLATGGIKPSPDVISFLIVNLTAQTTSIILQNNMFLFVFGVIFLLLGLRVYED
ncbi:hypothetical protein KJ765_00815 [Candidatus Micrarchaeota archaeon]|nr:hypothetical protein [Candidatus Micrarchaeota archaeon]